MYRTFTITSTTSNMKKIMFNDRFGLTKKVLDGNKTQTRRIIPQSVIDKVEEFRMEYYDMTFDALTVEEALQQYFFVEKLGKLPYKVGEVVAVAQSYKEVFGEGCGKESETGYSNKMFVKPELMPHQIRITGVRIERLQDISEEDVLKEGFSYRSGCEFMEDNRRGFYLGYLTKSKKATRHIFDFCAQTAYSILIDSISSKKVWKTNPLVFVYDFELLK